MRKTKMGSLIIGSTDDPKFIKKMMGGRKGRVIYSSSEDPNHERSSEDIMRIILHRALGEEGIKDMQNQLGIGEEDLVGFVMNLRA